MCHPPRQFHNARFTPASFTPPPSCVFVRRSSTMPAYHPNDRFPRCHHLLLAVTTMLLIAMSGCNDQNKAGDGMSDRPGVRPPNTALGGETSQTGTGTSSTGTGRQTQPPTQTQAQTQSQTQSQTPMSVWAIAISTSTEEDHARQAQQNRAQIAQAAPQLGPKLWVHTTARGSMVVYGQYMEPEDAAAQRDLQMVKDVDINGRKLFAGAMLSRLENPAAQANLHPHDLLSLRRQFPNVDPMYTLDIAVWIAEEGSVSSWNDTRARAERYTAQLRGRGFEAFFHHDHVRRMSTVTVGKFDSRAFDQRSGLLSGGVRELMEQFPARLVNGEELLERTNPRDPNSSTRPQGPIFVEVPRPR